MYNSGSAAEDDQSLAGRRVVRKRAANQMYTQQSREKWDSIIAELQQETESLQRSSARLEQETVELHESNNVTRYEISRAQMGLDAAKNEGKWLKIELDCLRRKALETVDLSAIRGQLCLAPEGLEKAAEKQLHSWSSPGRELGFHPSSPSGAQLRPNMSSPDRTPLPKVPSSTLRSGSSSVLLPPLCQNELQMLSIFL